MAITPAASRFGRRGFLAGLPLAPSVLGSPGSIGFAIGTYGMKPIPTLTAVQEIARIGYDGVALALMPGWPCDPAQLSSGDRRIIGNALDRHGLALPSVNDALPLMGTREKRAYNIERIKLAAGFVHSLRRREATCLDTILGLKTWDWETAKDRMADELHTWARLAEAEDFTIGIKPHAGQAMDTPRKSLWMLSAVNSGRIRLVYDYSHMRVGGFGLEQSLQALLPSTVFISLKDSMGGPHSFEFLLPGDGNTDYVSYFRTLQRLRYAGFVSVEVSSMIQRKAGYDPLRTARTCYSRLAPLFRAAGAVRPRREKS